MHARPTTRGATVAVPAPAPTGLGRAASLVKLAVKRTLLRRGWHVGRYEIDWMLPTYLMHLFDARGINCVFDVGGRIGDYGTLLRQAGYRGHIISFEPVGASFARLQAQSDHDIRWIAYPYALGSRTGAATINVMRESSYSSMLEPSSYGHEPYFDGNDVERQEQIEIRRLDDVFDHVTRSVERPRVYLKMDTQGWDLEVFRGAEGCLEHILALQSEVSLRPIYDGMPTLEQALPVYRAAGFSESAFFRVTRDPFWRLVELDCVMVRDTDAEPA
jgi:FkbM family methyltransferase